MNRRVIMIKYRTNRVIKIQFVRSEDNDVVVFTKNKNQETFTKQTSKFMTDKYDAPKIIGKGVEEH